MKKKLSFLCGIFLVIVIIDNATAAVVTFDDIHPGGHNNLSLNSEVYAGIRWCDSFALVDTYMNYPYDSDNMATSGRWVIQPMGAYTPDLGSRLIEENGDYFSFNGASFSAIYNDGVQVTVTGRRDMQYVYSQTITVNSNDATWYEFNFIDIDNLYFFSEGGTSVGYGQGHPSQFQVFDSPAFVIDNFTYNESVNPVPEPATVWLLGSGLLGLVGFRRKLRK